jgi:hypothetical protein
VCSRQTIPTNRWDSSPETWGGESIPIAQVNLTRLQILELSPKVTIWTDDIHGTLDLDMSGGPFDPRRVVLHLEF